MRLCICVSDCSHSHGCISWSIFTKICTDVNNPKVKTSSLGQHRLPLFCPQNSKFMQTLITLYICLKCTRIAEIFSSFRNRGEGTRWCLQILERKRKQGRFVHAQWWNLCNTILINWRIAVIPASYHLVGNHSYWVLTLTRQIPRYYRTYFIVQNSTGRKVDHVLRKNSK